MRRSFNSHIALPPVARDARFRVRIVLGILLLANLAAAFVAFRPVGGSAEELDAELTTLRQQVQQRQAALIRLRKVTDKVNVARKDTDSFMSTYFLGRRTAFSTIVSELNQAAKDAGIRTKEHTFDPQLIEGTEDLSMMTVVGKYEGTYGDLLEFVNKLDKSPHFLILESLAAEPLQSGGNLGVTIKFNTFVREEAPQT